MNNTKALLLVALFVSSLVYADHIPVNGSNHHSVRNCRGYAVGRAFGLNPNNWSTGGCPLEDLGLSEIPETYFDIVTQSSLENLLFNVRVGDLILWGEGATHAAYVVQIGDWMQASNVNNVLVDQVKNSNGVHSRGVSLQWAIDNAAGLEPDALATLYTGLFFDRAENGFGGTTGQIKIGPTQDTSPVTIESGFADHHTLDAVDDGELRDGYVRLFYQWEDADGFFSGEKSVAAPDAHLTTGTISYTAQFHKEFNITAQATYMYSSEEGIIELGGIPYTGQIIKKVEEGHSIELSAPNRTIAGITHLFTYWKEDGNLLSYSQSITYSPDDHANVTAHFNSYKPTKVVGRGLTGGGRTPLGFTWT